MNNQIYVKEVLWLMGCKPTIESLDHAMVCKKFVLTHRSARSAQADKFT